MAIRKIILADFAARLAGAGIRAIPCRDKIPQVKWKIAAAIPAATWARAEALAIVCGENGLTAFDFDGDAGAALFENVRALLPAGAYVERSRHGGIHAAFRCVGSLPKSGRIGTLPVEVKAAGCLITTAPSLGYKVLSGDLLSLPVADPGRLLDALGGMAGPRVSAEGGGLPDVLRLVTALDKKYGNHTVLGNELRWRDRAIILYDGARLTCFAPGEPFAAGEVYTLSAALGALGCGGAATISLDETDISKYLDTEPEPLRFLIDGFLPKETAGGLIGASDACKTTFAWQLAVSGAVRYVRPCGVLPDGQMTIPDPFDTLIVQGEDDAEPFHRWAYAVQKNLTPAERDAVKDHVHFLGRASLLRYGGGSLKFITAKRERAALYDTVLEHGRKIPDLGLVLIDHKGKFGAGDENANDVGADEAEIYVNMRDELKATALVLCHTNKGSRDPVAAVDPLSALRGASSFADNLRWACWSRITGPGRVTLVPAKAKHGRPLPVHLRLQWPLLYAALPPGEGNSLIPLIVEAVRNHDGICQKDLMRVLRKRHKGDWKVPYAAIKTAVSRGIIGESADGRKRIYSLLSTLPE